MHPGMFVTSACNVGDPMTFKVLQCNEDPRKRNIVLHRGAVVLHSPTATGYNSALAPKSDAYFQNVQVEGGATSKTGRLCRNICSFPYRDEYRGEKAW